MDVAEETLVAYRKLIDQLMALPADAKRGPVVLRLSPQARARWIDFINAWSKTQDAVEDDDDLSAAYAKLQGYAGRFALVHHVVSLVDRGEDDAASAIELESIEAGITPTHWFAREAARVYAVLAESPGQRDMRRLVELIRTAGGRMNARGLMRARRTKYPTSEVATAALDELVQAGLAVWSEGPMPKEGGTAPHWIELTASGACHPESGCHTPGDDEDLEEEDLQNAPQGSV
jgi:hypothetical protein